MIYTMNIEKYLTDALAQKLPVLEFSKSINMNDIDGVFIEWVDENTNSFIEQAAVVDYCAKNKKYIVIYDSNFHLKEKEYRWLQKSTKSRFYESCIKNRPGFFTMNNIRQILWKDFDLLENIEDDDDDRGNNLYYNGYISNKYKTFEKYYRNTANDYPDIRVSYSDENISEKKKEYYKESNLMFSKSEWDDVDCSVLIGSYKDYMSGNISQDLYNMMSMLCIPLLPEEHRFFHSIFKSFIVSDFNTIEYFIRTIGKARKAIVIEISENIEKLFPELTMNHTVDTLVDFFKKG